MGASSLKTIVFWIVVALAAFFLWQTVKTGRTQKTPEISYSEFLSQVESSNVVKVTISKNEVNGKYRDNAFFHVIVPSSQEGMLQALRQKNVEIWYRDVNGGDFRTWLLNLAPLILLAALWFFMIKQIRSRQIRRETDKFSQTGYSD